MSKENEKLASVEVYRLTLEHYINANGQHVEMDEPLVVQMVVDRQFAPTSICLNSMLDKMRVEVLKRVGRIE